MRYPEIEAKIARAIRALTSGKSPRPVTRAEVFSHLQVDPRHLRVWREAFAHVATTVDFKADGSPTYVKR